ncbi:MAG: hypothetical protein K2J48_03985 [Muribaculaceae bacterium]|nr:hypothetical protein [Muribaculaceae bacterium]
MKSKITIMVIAIMLGLTNCGDDPKLVVNSNDFHFTAVNVTVDGGKLTAIAGNDISIDWTVTTIINGELTTLSGTKKVDELPVIAGNEIEIQFKPYFPEQTEATFTMPDGSSCTTTVTSPVFKWTVPKNFTSGMEIRGKTHYETDDCIYNSTGVITLVELK